MEQGTSIGPPPVTREHGAWAVLLVPFSVGAVVGGTLHGALLVLLVAVLAMFMFCVPAEILLRNFFGVPQPADRLRRSLIWGVIFLLAACGAGVPLVFTQPTIVALGIAGAVLFVLSVRITVARGKGVASDLTAIMGLTLTAPAAFVVSGGTSASLAVKLWAFNALFFGSSVFYVHMKMAAAGLKRDSLSRSTMWMIGRANLLYHCVVIGVVILLTVMEYTPRLAFLAFVPMLIHAIIGTFRLGASVRFKRLGGILLAHSIVFAVILTLLL